MKAKTGSFIAVLIVIAVALGGCAKVEPDPNLLPAVVGEIKWCLGCSAGLTGKDAFARHRMGRARKRATVAPVGIEDGP